MNEENNFCELCDNLEEFRKLSTSQHTVTTICKEPLKQGHILVLPTRHVTSLSDLTEVESKEFLNVVEQTKHLLHERYDETPIVFQNFGKHSSESHLHFHVLPSKGALRDLFASFEELPRRQEISKEKYEQMRVHILNNELGAPMLILANRCS